MKQNRQVKGAMGDIFAGRPRTPAQIKKDRVIKFLYMKSFRAAIFSLEHETVYNHARNWAWDLKLLDKFKNLYNNIKQKQGVVVMQDKCSVCGELFTLSKEQEELKELEGIYLEVVCADCETFEACNE
jgi:hypothetical protein